MPDEGIRAALVIRGRWPDIAILVLSQYVEERYAADLPSANTHGVGYLLKDRVADVAEFLDALRRVAAGGTALDPEVVAQLLARRGGDLLDDLTQRERDVLALMAEGRSNAEIGSALVITDSAVSKHIDLHQARAVPGRRRPPAGARGAALPRRATTRHLTRAAPVRPVSAQEAPVADDRHQQDQQAQPDLHPAGEPRRVDHLDQVVLDEPVTVPGLPGVPAQVVLQQRERAGEARELHQRAVYHHGDVCPDDPGPSPGEEDARYDEDDEQQVDDHHEVSASPVPHRVTCRTAYPALPSAYQQDEPGPLRST